MLNFLKKKERLSSEIKVPQHIAIIMDGNARWAKSRGLPLQTGHKFGSENIQNIAESCIEFGVKYLTIYAFSSENWDRPKEEVEYLMHLFNEYLKSETKQLIEKNIRIVISGSLGNLSVETKSHIKRIEEETKNNKALTVNVAFSYGARLELVEAIKKIVIAVKEEKIDERDIDAKLVSNYLYQPQIPDPDLLIRTGNDYRISNFLLWQLAYSELYFSAKFWPDFKRQDLLDAIIDFNKRERRYGKR